MSNRSFEDWLYYPEPYEVVCKNNFHDIVQKVYEGYSAMDPYAPDPNMIETKVAQLLKAELILLEGDVIYVEKLEAEAGSTVKFDRVLAVIDEAGSVFGTPVIEGAVVTGNVVKNGKGKKVRVYKMKPKKGYQRLQGHRQPYTKVQIETIG